STAGIAIGSVSDANRTRRARPGERAGDALGDGSSRDAQGIETRFWRRNITRDSSKSADNPYLIGAARLSPGFAGSVATAPSQWFVASGRSGLAACVASLGHDERPRHGVAGRHSSRGDGRHGASGPARYRGVLWTA